MKKIIVLTMLMMLTVGCTSQINIPEETPTPSTATVTPTPESEDVIYTHTDEETGIEFLEINETKKTIALIADLSEYEVDTTFHVPDNLSEYGIDTTPELAAFLMLYSQEVYGDVQFNDYLIDNEEEYRVLNETLTMPYTELQLDRSLEIILGLELGIYNNLIEDYEKKGEFAEGVRIINENPLELVGTHKEKQ